MQVIVQIRRGAACRAPVAYRDGGWYGSRARQAAPLRVSPISYHLLQHTPLSEAKNHSPRHRVRANRDANPDSSDPAVILRSAQNDKGPTARPLVTFAPTPN